MPSRNTGVRVDRWVFGCAYTAGEVATA
jgi:hypothetical protein